MKRFHIHVSADELHRMRAQLNAADACLIEESEQVAVAQTVCCS
jgi:hypothetical protein